MWGSSKIKGMNTVDEGKKIIQDFLAPELRTISARLDGLEKVMSVKFEAMDERITALDMKMDE